jgi:heat shock protein HslJ
MARGALEILVIVCTACACAGKKDDGELQRALVGRAFVSESVEGWQLVPGTEVRLAFDREWLSAGAGCNSIDARYDIDGTALEIPGYGVTEMGCDPALHAQDEWLIGFLRARPELALAEPRLTMTAPSARMVLLDREVASPDRPLLGTQWTGEGFSDGSMATGGPGWDAASVRFASDGSVEIQTGCQTGTGSFHANGATITFEGLVYDGAACAEPGLQFVSDRVLLVLDGSPLTHAIEETSLELQNGTNSFHFRATE